MGSAGTEQGVIDCSVGSIVWVRRRNGSWWPGRILGADELSASHIMSPRSGTPVKLLGREDASVDWYNLEKSKRVKAFRCGEFDDCIQRAEGSLGMPPKKREKYARREDAIIHALELERQLVGKKCEKTNKLTNNKIDKLSDSAATMEAVISSEQFENQNGEQFHPNSLQQLERDVVSPKVENRDDNDSCLLPRMRGLQEICLSSAPSEDKLPISSNGAPNCLLDSNVLLGGSAKAEGMVNEDRESLLTEQPLVRRHDKRRPLVQVLQATEKLSVSYLQPDEKSSFMSVLGDVQPGAGHAKKARYTYLAAESGDHFSGNCDLPSRTEISTPKLEGNVGPQSAGSCEENASDSTEYTETDSTESDSEESDTDDDFATLSEGALSIELQPKHSGRSEGPTEHGSTSNEELDDLSGADSHPFVNIAASAGVGVSKWQLKGKRNNRNLVKRSLESIEANHFRKANYMVRPLEKASCGGVDSMCSYPLGVQTMLIDVDLKVQASYNRQRVPMISLMSKINGQAIVGHPIQIEALEDGASLLSSVNVLSETLDSDTSLQPMWRTARRTAGSRVPRPNISSNRISDGFDQKPSSMRKNISRSGAAKTRKTPKRISFSSNQKIRSLSSLSSLQKKSCDLKVKQEIMPTTVIACIPVKLVFSRLNEELEGRPK